MARTTNATQRGRRATGKQDVETSTRQPPNPLYDPVRDGPPVYASPFAELMGDPPIGRRALDMRRDA